MRDEYRCDLEDIFHIFDDKISAADAVSAKALAEISSGIVKNRIERGMTQKEFAQYVGVSQGMISKWESADYNFSIKALSDIAVKLDLDLDIRLKKARLGAPIP